MKSRKVVIQDAIDIVFVDTVIQCTMRNVKFEFIPREQCEAVGKELEAISTKTIKRTMKIHVNLQRAKAQIPFLLVVSEITSTDRNNQPNDTVTENSTEIVTDNEMFVDTETYNIVDYIIAIYENKWNVDKIVDTDPEDESGFMYNVSFIEKHKKMFHWPGKKDIIWYKNTDIKCKLNTLQCSVWQVCENVQVRIRRVGQNFKP